MITNSKSFKAFSLWGTIALISTFGSVAQEMETGRIIDLEGYTVLGGVKEIPIEFSELSKLQASITDTPRSLSILNRERIDTIGAQSIQDSLAYMPGVHAAPYGVDSRLDSSRIRGIQPLKYHDGFQSLFGYYNNTRSDIFTLEQVEVVKGPSGVLSGRGSLGGIVNTVSKLPKTETIREIELQYGSFNRTQLGFDFGGKLNESSSLLYRLVGVIRESDTQVDHVADDAIVFMPSLTWLPSDSISITLLANIQDNHGGQSLQFLPNEGALYGKPEVGTNTFVGEPGWDRYDTQQSAYSFFYKQQFGDDVTFTINARYTDAEADYKSHWVAYDGADPVIAEDGTVNRTIYDAPATSKAFVWNSSLVLEQTIAGMNHQLQLMVDAQDVTNDTDSYYGFAAGGRINIYEPVYGNLATVYPVYDTPADISDQIGFSIRDHITWDQWVLALGARQDKVKTHSSGSDTNAIDETATTGDVGVLYKFKTGINPYLSWAESFEPLGTTTGLDGSVLQLDPKRGTQYEAGIKYQPNGSKSLFTVAIFQMEETERPISNGQFVKQTNVDTQGFEFEAQTNWKDWYLQAGYSYSEALDGNENQIVAVPKHQGVFWATWKPETESLKPFQFGFGGRYLGKTWDGEDNWSTDSQLLFDAMVSYRWKWAKLRLNISNIADTSYVATTQGGRSYYGARRTVNLTSSFTF